MEQNETQKIQCSECAKVFKNTRTFTKHYEKIHEEKSEFCNICGKGFTTKGWLNLHKKLEEEGQKCDICNKIFPHLKSLKGHLKNHENHVEFPCELCGKLFHSKANLRKHTKRNHSSEKFACDICNKVWPTRSDLVNHKKWNHFEKKYQCNLCQKKYSKNNDLKLHLTTHEEERKYLCQVQECGSSFKSNHYLKLHQKNVHMNSKAKCYTCLGEYKNIKAHMKNIHNKSGTIFKCELCPKEYKFKCSLQRVTVKPTDHRPTTDLYHRPKY